MPAWTSSAQFSCYHCPIIEAKRQMCVCVNWLPDPFKMLNTRILTLSIGCRSCRLCCYLDYWSTGSSGGCTMAWFHQKSLLADELLPLGSVPKQSVLGTCCNLLNKVRQTPLDVNLHRVHPSFLKNFKQDWGIPILAVPQRKKMSSWQASEPLVGGNLPGSPS